MSDDVAPTSLNEGRGEVSNAGARDCVPFGPEALSGGSMGPWWWYERRESGSPNVEMFQMRNSRSVPFWEGAQYGISRGMQ